MHADAVLSTLELPGAGARDLVCQAREFDPDVPVFLICDREGESARERAHDLGADELLVRPLRRAQLVERVLAAIGRRPPGRPSGRGRPGPFDFEGLLIDPAAMTVSVAGGLPVALTPYEFRMIWVLAKAGGAILTRNDIYERIWGGPLAIGDRSVDVLVRRVRKKLELLPRQPAAVHTHHRLGYRLGSPVHPDGVGRRHETGLDDARSPVDACT